MSEPTIPAFPLWQFLSLVAQAQKTTEPFYTLTTDQTSIIKSAQGWETMVHLETISPTVTHCYRLDQWLEEEKRRRIKQEMEIVYRQGVAKRIERIQSAVSDLVKQGYSRQLAEYTIDQTLKVPALAGMAQLLGIADLVTYNKQ